MLTTAVLAVLLQVGPNPSTGAVPELPPEILDWREMEAQKKNTEVSVLNRLESCLERAEEDSTAARIEAEDWLARAEGLEKAQALHCRGYADAQLTRWSDAAQSFVAAREAVGDLDVKYRARLGAIAGSTLITAGDYSGALGALDLAATDAAVAGFTPLGGEIQLDRARALLAMENSAGAAAALTNARRLTPTSSRAWLLSATLARRTDDLEIARDLIAQAGKIDPASPQIMLEAGLIAALSGNDDMARDNWEKLISTAPTSPQRPIAEDYLRQLEDG